MYNYFTILGPQDDPAQIRDSQPTEALKRIAVAKHRFVSRGDDSGTHKRELRLWQEAGGRPRWREYVECGQGMGATLVMANEMQGYVFADKGTYLKFKEKIELVPLVSASQALRNPYSVITVNPKKHQKINGKLADALVEFLIWAETQQLIKDYRIAGQQLFYPTRLENHN